MIEMKNDVMRRATYDMASQEARKDTFNYEMHQTMEERLGAMREKQMRPKRKKPWFLIFTVVTTIPIFFMGDMLPSLSGVPQMITPEQQLQGVAKNAEGGEMATVSVTIAGKTVSKQIPVSEVQSLQATQYD